MIYITYSKPSFRDTENFSSERYETLPPLVPKSRPRQNGRRGSDEGIVMLEERGGAAEERDDQREEQEEQGGSGESDSQLAEETADGSESTDSDENSASADAAGSVGGGERTTTARVPQPRGRPRKGHTWNSEIGRWEEDAPPPPQTSRAPASGEAPQPPKMPPLPQPASGQEGAAA